MIIKGVKVVYYKVDGPEHGEFVPGFCKTIYLWGPNKLAVVWVLAHELAHALEPNEKKPRDTYNKGPRQVDHEDPRRAARRFDGSMFYPYVSAEEFQASRRSYHYLPLACSGLGVSIDRALSVTPPKHLKRWWDGGYWYQWYSQITAANKLRPNKKAAAKRNGEIG